MDSKMNCPIKPQTMTNLNDDCLRAIFVLLPVNDVVVLSKCCRSFNKIANEIINKKMSTTRIEAFRFPSKLLEKFGEIIKWLDVSGNTGIETGIEELKQVHRLCPNLRKLSIRWLHLEVFYAPFFADLLERLTDLSLQFRYSNDVGAHITRTMQRCKNLECLTLNGYEINLTAFLVVSYPKLHLFKIRFRIRLSDFVDAVEFDKFCTQNQQLKHIDIEFTNYPFEIFGVLDLQNLDSIHLTAYSLERFVHDTIIAVVVQLFTLPALRLLKMTGSFKDIPSIKHLKQLHAVEFHIETDAYYYFGDKSENRFNKFDLKELAELPLLRQFTLIHEDENDNTLEEIIDVVQKNRELKTLIIPGFKQSVRENLVADGSEVHQKFMIACQKISGATITCRCDDSNSSKTIWWTFPNKLNIVNAIRSMLL